MVSGSHQKQTQRPRFNIQALSEEEFLGRNNKVWGRKVRGTSTVSARTASNLQRSAEKVTVSIRDEGLEIFILLRPSIRG